ncbi:hypothetical protein BV898_00581 [Hypsibius exemplaris]|uniref:Complexin-1 n=1 Tax=Hypsibius exemplaris TaxID=2072580 RepID=A0A1W0XDT8_HYPEX|nr:hypothetical protein BV898_00581 [Hypsibius exemplaris]
MEFVAKQMFASKMGEVKNLAGGDGEKKEGEEASAETDPEIIKAREEAEEARKEKHRKMEEQREGMRQGIRDKYGLKKKEIVVEEAAPTALPGMEGRLNKPKADQALLAQQAAMSDEDLPLMQQAEKHFNSVKEAATGLFAKLPFFK